MKTEIVAWWGAILASIVFVWDIYKWWTAGPKLRVSVHTGMMSINMPQYDGKTLIHVNVSNYGWFTGTPEMEQALAHAAFRASENGRPFVLASNNGICATFDRWGSLIDRTEPDVPAAFVCRVDAGANAGTLFMATGEGSAWFLGLAGLACVLVLRRRLPAREEAAKSVETS